LLLNCCCLLAQSSLISGIVFLDENRDGIYNQEEQILEGIFLSNQKEIVKTDKEDRYSINLRDGAFLYVLKPSGISSRFR